MNGVQRSTPARPSQDLGYGSSTETSMYGGQNGYDSRLQNGSNARKPSVQGPNGSVILDGYRNEILNGFETTPRFNPLNTTRPQSSMLLNVNDPIQVHLLVETALGDSKEYEILSQEEVDDLKKQVQILTQRIELSRQNLAIQSKYRDAAISMSRLYSPSHNSKGSDGTDKKQRRSILGHRSTNSMQEADAERIATERKCEELAAELWSLEKRLMEPQNRLLKHTAGILQMTHKGPKKGTSGVQPNGMPGSPESMYTYSNARTSVEQIPDEILFDERSLYRDFLGDIDRGDKLSGPPPKSQAREHLQMIAKTEQKLEDLNSRLRDVIVQANPERSSELGHPPLSRTNADGRAAETGETLQSHLDYLEKSITTINQQQATTIRNDQGSTETVLLTLWDDIQSGEEETRRRKQERRATRAAQGLADDEDDSPDEDIDPNEVFSLQAFSSKVKWLYSQATRLKDQKKVLQRQIKQQRELNSKSDATKDAELTAKTEELERTQNLLTRTERDGNSVREQLSLVMEKLDEARQQERMRDQSRANDESTALRQRNETISQLTAELAEKEKSLEAKEQEMDDMNMKLAELQTEVTIARAELDGAYGTRAQRAAEVAANPVIQKEIDDLTKKNASLNEEISQLKTQGSMSKEAEEKMKTLKKELEETIEEYELMTKASIEWEKDREALEGTIDKLRDEREALEAQLSDEKVRWLGMKSPGVDSQGAGSTSTTVLKNEFKKMMRDTRAESQRTLRAEQAERRKLEDELRALKRAQGPGKSSLSQSMGAS